MFCSSPLPSLPSSLRHLFYSCAKNLLSLEFGIVTDTSGIEFLQFIALSKEPSSHYIKTSSGATADFCTNFWTIRNFVAIWRSMMLGITCSDLVLIGNLFPFEAMNLNMSRSWRILKTFRQFRCSGQVQVTKSMLVAAKLLVQ